MRPWCVPVGLVGLLTWLLGGLVLEAFHGVKARLYLEDDLRREVWTLAHAHGTLLAALCLVLVVVLPRLGVEGAALRRIDRLFAVGAALLPLGFLLGGAWHSEADPGPFILLVPVGGILAATALVLALVAWRRAR